MNNRAMSHPSSLSVQQTGTSSVSSCRSTRAPLRSSPVPAAFCSRLPSITHTSKESLKRGTRGEATNSLSMCPLLQYTAGTRHVSMSLRHGWTPWSCHVLGRRNRDRSHSAPLSATVGSARTWPCTAAATSVVSASSAGHRVPALPPSLIPFVFPTKKSAILVNFLRKKRERERGEEEEEEMRAQMRAKGATWSRGVLLCAGLSGARWGRCPRGICRQRWRPRAARRWCWRGRSAAR